MALGLSAALRSVVTAGDGQGPGRVSPSVHSIFNPSAVEKDQPLAYVGEPFRHDIFVSYSHGADAQGQPQLKDWSVAFVRALEQELRSDRDYRNTLSMFIDAHDRPGQRLDPMAPLTEQLNAHVGASALLLVLMSPDYQASTWCRDERQWWAQQQAGTGLPAAGRVAMVHAWPLQQPWPDERWPAELSDQAGHPLVGYGFHSGQGRAARPLGWTEWSSGFGPELRTALLGLAGDLYHKLDQIKADAQRLSAARADSQRLAEDGGQTIYLHGRADSATGAAQWAHSAQALLDGGYAVLPGEPDPVERDPARLEAIRERRVEALAACDALLLVGGDDGRAIDADLIVVGKHDRHSARARSNRWLPCALLDTIGPAVATAVRRSTARIVQADWLDATQAPLVPVVRHWLQGKAGQGPGA